ncbi:MAG: HRDC domain-containing protein, partial [Euryarchaeota archaeon]|nr:HRDC domain-containing protein [Euryarchaeota archaeon]
EVARTIIDQMMAKGYLITKQGSSSYPRPQLYLTELAEKALKEQIAIELQLPVKKAELCETGNSSVLEALKEWRKRIAAENRIPAYCVFHDSTLIGIANRLPKTTQELQTVKGIGERKIENYGDEILKIVDEVD